MFIRTTALTPVELRAAIVREPLVVSPDTTVMDAIAQMSGMRAICDAAKTVDGQRAQLHLEVRSSCVLVMEDRQLLGILTERDVVLLSAQQRSLENLAIREVMLHPVVTLHESALTDLFFAISLLQQYHIRHLPILDEHDRLVGIVTHESLRQTSRPIDLLRLRLVSEVMTSDVICVAPDTSMLAIAQRMSQHRVSSVMILEPGDRPERLQIPVGIVTERDIVQFQALGLDQETCTAQGVMSTPIFAVRPDDSLWTVQQMMEQRSSGRLAVTSEQGELLGIVTQTSLLQALNPLELYKLAQKLEEKVVRQEAEKIQMLENIIEEQVEARTIALKAKAGREKLVAELATQIYSSLSLQTILDTTVEQVRQVLGCDRVNIWQFEADGQVSAVAESTDSSLSLIGERIEDTWFKQDQAEMYRLGRIHVVPDIYTIAMSDCHRNLLIRLQTRAKILVPLLCGDKLWGLLNASESQHPREWQPEEIELVQALSVHLAIALGQATTHQKLQEELTERRQAEARLRESEQRYATLAAAAPVGIFRTDPAGLCTYINERYFQLTGLTPEAAIGNGWQQALHPDDHDWVIAEWEQFIQDQQPFQLEYRFQSPDCVVTWIYGQSVAEQDAKGQIVGYLGTVTDITDRKQAEAHLQESEERYATLVEASPVGIFRTDAAGNCIYVNDRWCQISGLTPTSAFGDGWREGLHPDDRVAIATEWQQSIEENRPFQLEYRFQRPDGGVTWVYGQSVAELDTEGQAIGYVGTVTDISDRKQTEVALSQLAAIVESSAEAIISKTLDGAIVSWNAGAEKLFGYQAQEVIGQSILLLRPTELRNEELSILEKIQQGEAVTHYETVRQNKDGKLMDISFTVSPIKDGTGKIVGASKIARDISDRKQAEAALIESEAQSRAILAAIPDFMFRVGADGIYRGGVTANREIDFLPIDFDSTGFAMVDVMPAEIATRHLHYLEQALRTGELQIYEQQVQIGDRFHDEEVRVVKSSEDEALFMIRDISDRKQAERQLYQLNQHLEAKVAERTQELWQVNSLQRAILDGADYSIISTDPTGIIQTFNAGAERMLGYSAAEIVGKVTPAFIHDVNEVIDRAGLLSVELGQNIPPGFEVFVAQARQGTISEEEWSYIRKDGSRFPVSLSITALKDANQQIIGFLAIAKDISDRKRTAAELQKLSDRLALSLKSGAIGCWEWDIAQNTILGDERMYELFGLTKQSNSYMVYDLWMNRLHPDDRTSTETLLHQAVLGQTEYDTEYRILHPDGSIHFVKAFGVVVRDVQGNPQSMIGVNFDITDRKHIELERQQLIQELSAFKLALDHSASVAITDGKGVISYVNDRFSAVSGYSRDELIGKTHRLINSGYHPPDFFQNLWRTIASGLIWRGEICNGTKNGSLYWVASTIVPFLDEGGRPFQYLAIHFDITDRKLAEATLQQENSFRQQIVENMAEGLCVFNETEKFPFVRFTVWNQQMQAITGYTLEEINHLGLYRSVYPDLEAQEQAIANLRQIQEGESFIAQEREIQRKDGQKRTIAISASILSSNDGLIYILALIQDITDRKQIEAQLAESEGKFRQLVEGGKDVIWSSDKDGIITYLSPQFKNIFGWEESEWIGKPFIELVHPDDRLLVYSDYQQNLNFSKTSTHSEFRYYYQDGNYIWVRTSITAIRNAKGVVINIQGVLSDISDRKQAELRLEQQAKQERLLGSINQRMRSSLNLNEILNVTVEEVHQVLQSDRVLVYRVFPGGTGAAIAESVLPKWPKILDIVFPEEVFPKQNYDRYLQGRVYALSDREDENQSVLPCLIEFLASIHVRAKLVVPIILNQSLWGLLIAHHCDRPRQWEDWEINLFKQTANQLAIAIQQSNLFEQLQTELAERQRAEAQLTETNAQLGISNEELIRATRLKDAFLANMSHELRTPLNAILGMSEGLQDQVFGIVNERQIKALQTIERSGFHLLELIDDILDVAKIESGQMELDCTPVSVNHLCQSSLAFIRQQALQKRLQLEIKLQLNLPDLLIDERRIRQVLINLLNNAVKFTPEGGRITLEVSRQQRPADPDSADSPPDFLVKETLRIAVIDTGIGIAPEDINKLFQPFIQIDSALNRQYTGTGLGLALVKRFVELHGGQVLLTSEVGVGSCFAIDLPCTAGAPSSRDLESQTDPRIEPSQPEQEGSPLILLAEDNEANISTVSSYLRAKGYRILLAKNGEEAIALAKSENPNLILMDIQMPGMDGLEAMQQIRLDPSLVDVPIVALTALAMTGDRDRCLAAGANDYLSKPVKLKQLAATIQQLLTSQGR
ncbi:PAS domain S-box protein [Microcoleus sp. LAD1_D3]|uniref:PAS domain S-box protein n=1 Tax=Microcoleus sp. LAD1_D3 TaxID=2819365 RepID=UPI002FD76272